MYVSAQIFIVISSIFYGLSCFAKNKKVLFFVQIFSSLLYSLHCFFMHAYAGGIVSVFDMIRVLLFYVIERHNGGKKEKIITACILFCVAIVCAISTWQNWFSILPFVGTAFFIVSLGISNLTLIKLSTLLCATTSCVYLKLVGSNLGALFELFAVFIALLGLIFTMVQTRQRKKGNRP